MAAQQNTMLVREGPRPRIPRKLTRLVQGLKPALDRLEFERCGCALDIPIGEVLLLLVAIGHPKLIELRPEDQPRLRDLERVLADLGGNLAW